MSSAAVFGKRKEPHTIIIAQGDSIRHFTIRPWVAALAGSVLAAMAVGYLGATSYLMLRDDILNAAISRQARMQYAYEDRIAALRSQVDRITSYRLLDQQIMETKVAELLTRQSILAKRNGRLAPLLEKAESNGLTPANGSMDPARIPVPQLGETRSDAARTLFRPQKPVQATLGQAALRPATKQADDAKTPVLALSRLTTSLNYLENDQLSHVNALTLSARKMREQLVADAREAGLPLRTPTVESLGVGGPFIPANRSAIGESFELELDSLNRELEALDAVRGKIRMFPIGNPVPGRSITSGYGNRRDPIIGRSAFHGGIDFSAPTGTPIVAAGSGKVIKAGRAGGYGNMVEIRHANGLTTRYAHMSSVSVKKGQNVTAGTKVGEAGSTGRSTGPHLHYEVRRDSSSVNPMTYLKAGTRLGRYL